MKFKNDDFITNKAFADRIKSKYNKYLIPLTESNLNRILHHADIEGYVIISASRGEYSDAENKERTNALRREITQLRYPFVPVFGSYQEDGSDNFSLEYSFIVYPINRDTKEVQEFESFADTMRELGKKYEQDTILIVPPKGTPRYVQCVDGRNADWNENGFSSIKINHPKDGEPFTIIKQYHRAKSDKSPHRYTYVESFLDEQPDSMHDYGARRQTGEYCHFGRFDFEYKMN